MMSVLITGSTGFVGKNLIDHLYNCGIEVNVLNRNHHKNEKIAKSFIWNDFDEKALIGIDTAIHLAGKAHDTKNVSSPEAYFEINTALTKTLFDTFLTSTANTFIYFSSVKAVADTVEDILYEDAPYLAHTPYGQSKEQAEKYILQYTTPDKRVFILRPCMVHGPGNKGNLNLLYKFVAKGIPYPLAAFQNSRSFLSVDNLTYVVQHLITKQDIQGGIYNLADDVPLSTTNVITIIAEVIGNKPQIWKISTSFISILAKIGDVLHLPLNSERLKKLTESYVVSNTKIKAALSVAHFPVSSAEGLKKTIKSFSQNN